MPAKDQHIFFNNRELDDADATLQDCNLDHDDDIDVCLMRINVVMPDGLKIPIDCKPTDDVQSIKKITEKKTKIPVHEQKLLFKGEVLDDPSASLGPGCGVKHNDDIVLEGMIVSVETPEGKTIDVACKPTDSIQILKQKIQEQTALPIDQQILKSEKGKTFENDKKKLEAAGIKHGQKLKVERMQVNVVLPDESNLDGGSMVQVFCSPNDTIATIKKKLEKKSGTPAREQLLQTNDGDDLDDDSDTLKDLGIKNYATLVMDQFSITVKTPDGEKVKVLCGPREYVRDIKERVEEEAGIASEGQILTKRDGTDLFDDMSTLESYDIKNKEVLNVDQFHIRAKTPDGDVIPVYCGPMDTIEEGKLDKILNCCTPSCSVLCVSRVADIVTRTSRHSQRCY